MQEVEYIENLLKPLLKHPEEMTVDKITDDRGILLNIIVNGNDLGRCVGKGGETAKCLRHILHVLGSTNGIVLSLKISTPTFRSANV